MNWTTSCAAVIPCLNEAASIGAVVRDVRRHLPTVLVVDDGSSDATGVEAARAGAVVLRHPRPCGKGAALDRGWREALARGFQWAMTLDGDGQHSADDIPDFLERATATRAALVVGNRMIRPARMPWIRRFVNRWMSRRISRATGIALPDTQCGFRLMNLDAWAALPITTAHFEVESETLLAFAVSGRRIEFVPVEVIYRGERSKINPFSDTVRWFRWWLTARHAVAAAARGPARS